ncbi:MAG: hypothetical protein QXP45_04790 [Thermoproteota archaeon]
MTGAKVWGWGEDPELAGENAQKYVDKRWKATTKECSIGISGKDSEDILFGITVYISEPKGTRSIVDDMMDIALSGRGKLYFLTVSLHDNIVSETKVYRNDLEAIYEVYKKREQYLLQKFKNHPKVRALNEGKELVVSFVTTVICELESKRVNKVIVDAGNFELESILKSLHLLTNETIKREMATCLLGYELWGDPDKLEIDDLYVENDKVYLWLSHPAVKH